jgi:Flp pilus assembly secretin CpaC
MRVTPQRRAAISKCGVAFALCGASIAALAQTPSSADQAPSNSKTVEATTGSPTRRQTQAAEDAYLAGARSLERNDLTNAEIQFDKAVKLNPFNNDYAMAYSITHQRHVTELVKESGKARLLGQNTKAETLLAEARLLDPQNSIVGQSGAPGELPKLFHPKIEPWIREGPAIAGPVTLMPNPGTKSFHLRSDEQDVIRQVLSGYGVHASFDESVQRQNIRFDLDDSPYEQAVPILLNMTHLFAVPLDAKSVLIAKDTPENRQRLERQLQETIYIPAMTNEQMDELGNVIRNVFDVKQLTVDKSAGTLVIRAPQETLTYVNLTLADLIDGGSEVMIELKLYAIDRTNQRNIGAQLPQQIGLYNVASAARDLVNANQSLVNQAIAQGLIPAGSSNITIALALIASGLVQSTLLSNTLGFFGGGITQTGITVNQNFTYNLALTASDTQALNDIQIRVVDRQPATFRIGERFPITTATYSTASPAQTSALAGVSINGVSAASLLNAAVGSPITIPQIQYEDLGLTLKATPLIQRSGAIKMHLELKIEALAGGSINAIPILNSQQFASDVTVDDGDTAVMVSSLTKSESASISGYPGLADLPGFQQATADTTTMTDSSNLILLVTPHVTRRRANLTAGPRIAINLPEPSS